MHQQAGCSPRSTKVKTILRPREEEVKLASWRAERENSLDFLLESRE
jgi:hypothetical protein